MPVNLFRRLMGRRGSAQEGIPRGQRPTARIPDGLRVYAVGDIHGRADLLDHMALLVADDLADRPLALFAPISGDTGSARLNDGRSAFPSGQSAPPAVAGAITIFLGDYIDRGPNSKAVIDRVVGGPWPTPTIPLMGNHELMCLQFLRDPLAVESWRDVGALPTLASYGVDVGPLLSAKFDAAAADRVRREFEAALPPTHLAFLANGMELCTNVGDFFFCHAGVRPNVPLEDQDPLDLLTIRDTFLGSGAEFGKVVVHGHTPGSEPVVRDNRIGIDTGAYATGRLTALVVEADSFRFLVAD